MNNKRWFLLVGFITGVLVLFALLGSVTQTALMQSEAGRSKTTAVSQQVQVSNLNSGGISTQSVNAIIPDGSFEQVPSLWTEWDIDNCPVSSINDWSVVTGYPARDGEMYFWAGGSCEDVSIPTSNYAEQVITIPPDNPALSFWYLSDNPDGQSTNEDYAYVELFDNQTQTYFLAWQLTMSPATNTNGWVHTSVDLTPFAGRQMTLRVGAVNQDSGIPGAYAGSMFFDLFEFSDPPPTTSEIGPSGGFLQYDNPYTNSPVTQVSVPSGAVRSRTVLQYTPAADPGFPLVPVGESPLGVAKLTYAGIAFDLEAFDNFVYLPLVINNSNSTASTASDVTVTEIAAPDAVEAPHSFQFNQPLKVTIHYDVNKLEELGISEKALFLYYWTGDGWQDAALTCAPEDYIDPPATTYVRDFANHSFTLHVCHFTRFGTVGVN